MEAQDLAVLCARLCSERKGEDIQILDLRGLTDFTDYFVLASIETRVQMKAIVAAIETAAKARGVRKLGIEGVEVGRWVLIDFNDCVVHLFEPEVRRYYELETLWGDAPVVAWKGSGSAEL